MWKTTKTYYFKLPGQGAGAVTRMPPPNPTLNTALKIAVHHVQHTAFINIALPSAYRRGYGTASARRVYAREGVETVVCVPTTAYTVYDFGADVRPGPAQTTIAIERVKNLRRSYPAVPPLLFSPVTFLLYPFSAGPARDTHTLYL